MNRKSFIKQSLMGGAATLLLPPLISCDEEKLLSKITTNKRIFIIGGGIAGLAAAFRLKERGIDATIIEAQAKIGGRISTNRSAGFAFDEGASWIHGPIGNPITEIATLAKSTTFLTDDESLEVFDSDKTKYSTNATDRAYEQYLTSLNNVIKNGSEQESFETVFAKLYANKQNDRLWKYMLSAYLEFDTGGDISELSSTQFDDDENFKGKDRIITDGFDKITDFLAKGIDIKLNEKVSAIDYSGSEIKIKTDVKSYSADYVLVTLPLGVLKKNIISFNPILPTKKRQAIEQIKVGVVNKFLLTFPSVFWNEAVQYIGFTPETKGKFNYFLNLKKFLPQSALMTFAFGKYASITEEMTDNQIVSEIMAHLKNIYGNNIPNPDRFLRTRWGNNQWAFGAYSFAAVGSSTAAFDTLAETVENKIFFAGEHTNRDYRGTVHGAFLSGQREANNIINLL